MSLNFIQFYFIVSKNSFSLISANERCSRTIPLYHRRSPDQRQFFPHIIGTINLKTKMSRVSHSPTKVNS